MMSYWGIPKLWNFKKKSVFSLLYSIITALFCTLNKLNIMSFDQEYTIYFLWGSRSVYFLALKEVNRSRSLKEVYWVRGNKIIKFPMTSLWHHRLGNQFTINWIRTFGTFSPSVNKFVYIYLYKNSWYSVYCGLWCHNQEETLCIGNT